MEEISNPPLDLEKLCILPPSEWDIRPCDGGVVIGAWMEYGTQRIHKRFFKFTVYPSDAESPTMTLYEAKTIAKRLVSAWPIDCPKLSAEAMREALSPYRTFRDAPLGWLPGVIARFSAAYHEATIQYAKPDPNGAASLLLS